MKISIISVLYNQKLTTGNTWKTLLEPALRNTDRSRTEDTGETGGGRDGSRDDAAGAEIRVVLADNSTDEQIRKENREAAEACGADYLDMQGNRGLSAAYNRAIESILRQGGMKPGTNTEAAGCGRETERASEEEENNKDWIVVADQDTAFPEAYLQALCRTAEQGSREILAPVVRAGEKQLSPCRRKGSRFVPYAEGIPGEAELQKAFFINSGMAFRTELFADTAIRYDGRLFLDFTDFDLVSRIRSRTQAQFGLLPGIVLQQNFSGTEVRTTEQDLERFRHFAHDGRLFYERWYGTGAAESAIRLRALKLTAKHRDIRFLKNL